MSDWLNERAEDILDDTDFQGDEGVREKARAYVKEMEAFEEVEGDVWTSGQCRQDELDAENLRTMLEAGWIEYPPPDTAVTPVSESHRMYGKVGRTRYNGCLGCVSVEYSKVLICGIPLATLKKVEA